MERDKTDIKDKLKDMPDVHTCMAMQSDNGHHYCWFSGDSCGYKQKDNCPDYKLHIKPREEKVYL